MRTILSYPGEFHSLEGQFMIVQHLKQSDSSALPYLVMHHLPCPPPFQHARDALACHSLRSILFFLFKSRKRGKEESSGGREVDGHPLSINSLEAIISGVLMDGSEQPPWLPYTESSFNLQW